MMETKIEFVTKDSGWWSRYVLIGEWPEGWHVPYADLDSAALLPYFKVPPASGEGMLPDTLYQMDDTRLETDFAAFIDLLLDLINSIKPAPPTEPGVKYQVVG